MKPLSLGIPVEGSTGFEALVDNYLPWEFRQHIEEKFYGRVGEQAKLEHIKHDPTFLKNPVKHIALFTDHSTVHVRDVATQVLEVVGKVNGQLIPLRDKHQLEFLKAYALQVAYLHDIGMADFSPSGRFMHPEFAAQYVYCPEFEEMLELLWEKNAGNLPWILMRLFKNRWKEEQLIQVYRELLSLSIAHSKSKVPIQVVNDPQKLRERMLWVLSKPLDLLFIEQKMARLQAKPISKDKPEKVVQREKKIQAWETKRENYLKTNVGINPHFENKYAQLAEEAFSWLNLKEAPFLAFILHVQDSLRCLRTADALRQRGTVLRTSAGYEIFVDRKTANAIYALRNEANDELFLLEARKSINAGEANLASSELDAFGNLRVSFHLGSFSKPKVTQKAAKNAAQVIDDIQADTIQSFQRNATLDKGILTAPKVAFEDIQILIESTDDNPNFAKWVIKALEKENPEIGSRVKEAFSLQKYDLDEIRRYLDGQPLAEYLQKKKDFRPKLLTHLDAAGYRFSQGESIPGEQDIRVITLNRGEQLIKGGSSSGFVYFPMKEGLRVFPLGGYESRLASAWVALGNTGVIRGSIRNSHVYAEKNLSLICVPKDIYLNYWYKPLSAKDLKEVWR